MHDLIIGTSQWALVAALMFSVKGRERMRATAPLTAFALTVMAGTLAHMAFWNSAVACGSAASCWYVITIRAFRRRKENPCR